MFDFVLFILAFIITIPIVATVGLYFILKLVYGNPIRALHKAVNWTTILHIIAGNVLLTNLFNGNYIGYIIVFLLLLLTILITFQWKKHTEVDIKKALKLSWRLCFLIFFCFYIVLVLYGIIERIIG
ncbi:DUF3397 domain-containing protein [Ornithinibacillus bavariensis]|uniref:DUF3397 domain-containing protein n=1 Tax=Ornithinibacillus bavariensis TaxID=545502 RepID=UPI000EEB0059|nr:hypothetical protein [Ornithinibacillus sp.]